MSDIDDPFVALRLVVGNVVLTWAHAENMLAAAIGIIHHQDRPLPGYAEPPVALKKRIAFLRRASGTVLVEKHLGDAARLLAERFAALKEGRHELVHGAGWQITEGVFENLRVIVEGGQTRNQQRFIKIGDAVLFERKVIALTDQACTFLASIISAYEE